VKEKRREERTRIVENRNKGEERMEERKKIRFESD
jgi:hypothetical protein